MHSQVVIVAQAGRMPRMECLGGIAARSTMAETVHLVSSVATPLGGDTISIRVVVEPGARLALRSVAAMVALPGRADTTSRSTMHLEVAGHLDLDMEPTVVAADARHLASITADIDAAGALRLRERVQIGRTNERQGFWSGSLRADVKGQPLLRHRVELGAGAVADDALSAPRACVSELTYPGSDSTAGELQGSVSLNLAGGGVLTTWQGEKL
ncbi:urease accessory protein [Mycobacterium sp. MS1601]|uniref:urease accessory protein UreD n=1 Tax=Mycobacterium sp. MS1601 TaxID=1936029 RepID=UPI00097954AE|nr:urease accessory protein UreD [Mycobacterium sp. MS1601]AQA05330.1 urease accessory protein [Mycobacterium sp. MS1601]